MPGIVENQENKKGGKPMENQEKPKMLCNACKAPIVPNEPCYQLRLGNIEEDGITFLPDEDVGYYHQLCLVGLP